MPVRGGAELIGGRLQGFSYSPLRGSQMTGFFGATRVNTKLTGVLEMRSFTKFAAAAVLSLSVVGMATSASALQPVSIGTSSSEAENAINWDGTGNGTGSLFTGLGGTFGSIETILNWNNFFLIDGAGTPAFLTLSATADNGNVTVFGDGTFRQDDLDGYFEFRTAANGGGSLLLRGDFSGMWLNGRVGDITGAAQTILAGGTMNFTSPLPLLHDITQVEMDNAGFSFQNARPVFAVIGGNGGQLQDFTASGVVGTFGGAVPEPGTWALMIMGFGGAGAMLRSRRRSLALSA